MQEGAIMEVVKWFIGLLVIFSIVAISIFAINISSVNNYKQQVNYEIERHGGLTTEALEALEEYSEDNYGGRFSVESDLVYEQVPFGEAVDYKVIADVDMVLIPIELEPWKFEGTGVSYVR